MTNSTAIIRHCENGKGWCVEALHETYGPIESEAEASLYARLMDKVNVARTQIACTD